MRFWIISINIFLFFNSSLSLALENGHCISYPESKQYLESFKNEARKPSFQQTNPRLAAVVAGLQDSPSAKYYFCRVHCKALGLSEELWTMLSEPASRHEVMDGFLCPAVTIESVNLVGSIYSPQPIAHPFAAYNSTNVEISEWLKKINFKLSEEELKANRDAMDKIFNQIGIAFVTANSLTFQQAGQELLEIANHTDRGQALLEQYLNELIAHNWELKADYTQAAYFVKQQLSIYGRFLRY